MFQSKKLSLKQLGELSRRTSMSLSAGIESRKVWSREADRFSGEKHAALAEAAAAMQNGDSLEESIKRAGVFPEEFCELIAVGEESGTTPRVLRSLADHYDQIVALRRSFIRQITWPVMQLGMALVVVAIFLVVIATIAPGSNPLGLGAGHKAVMRYLQGLVAVGAIGLSLFLIFRGGGAFNGLLHKTLAKVPVLGKAIKTLAIAKVANILDLTLASGMEIRRSVELALRHSRWGQFQESAPHVRAKLTRGEPLHEALREQNAFPPEFLDAVEVGEETGQLPESMARLSKDYRTRAEMALAVIAQFAAYLIWAIVAMIIIYLIITIMQFAMRPYYEAMDFVNGK